jgi:hypothetical protein
MIRNEGTGNGLRRKRIVKDNVYSPRMDLLYCPAPSGNVTIVLVK